MYVPRIVTLRHRPWERPVTMPLTYTGQYKHIQMAGTEPTIPAFDWYKTLGHSVQIYLPYRTSYYTKT